MPKGVCSLSKNWYYLEKRMRHMHPRVTMQPPRVLDTTMSILTLVSWWSCSPLWMAVPWQSWHILKSVGSHLYYLLCIGVFDVFNEFLFHRGIIDAKRRAKGSIFCFIQYWYFANAPRRKLAEHHRLLTAWTRSSQTACKKRSFIYSLAFSTVPRPTDNRQATA